MKKKFGLRLPVPEIITFGVLGLVLFGILAAKFDWPRRIGEKLLSNASCVSAQEEKTVRGNSLSGLAEDGESVKVQEGYYNCHPVRRNDIAVYKYAGNSNPLIKIVKGVPGDKFGLEQSPLRQDYAGQGEGGWYIRLNGERLANSQGEPYR